MVANLSRPLCGLHIQRPVPWLNIKMSSYQYRKSYCGDKTVVRSYYLHNGISYTGKMSSLFWIRALASINIDSNLVYEILQSYVALYCVPSFQEFCMDLRKYLVISGRIMSFLARGHSNDCRIYYCVRDVGVIHSEQWSAVKCVSPGAPFTNMV